MTIMETDASGNGCRELVVHKIPEKAPVMLQKRTKQPANLGSWMVRVHMQAYRGICNVITGTASAVSLFTINKVSRPEEEYERLREFAPIDYTVVTCQRAINKVSQVTTGIDVFAPEELKTNNQRLKEHEIREMNIELGEDSAYSKFCRDTAILVDDLFPKLVCGQMIGLPSLGEQIIMYKLWLPCRYINYQILRRTNYRQKALDSGVFKTMERWYWFITTYLTHSVLSKDNVSPILNFEHVLLNICVKLKSKLQNKEKGKTLIDVILKSAATSIKRLQECNAYMENLEFDSRRDAIIERLEWYRRNKCLPPGMPDPNVERLNESNLEDELEKAMYKYLDEISTNILDEFAPKQFKNQFVRFVYWLEGKHGLVKLLSYLIGELGVNQVSDPHLFALAILKGFGVEVADFETDGFGRNKMDSIFKVGEKMVKHSLEEGVSSSVVVEDFMNTGLKCNPQSVENIKQKKEARSELEKILCDLIYDGIKPESYRHSGGLKNVRKFIQGIPVLGMATVVMNTLYSTLHLSFSYYFRSKDQQEDSFSAYFLKSMWGKDYTKALTKKTMELIYHPAWRFVVLQLIQDVTNHIFHKGEEVHHLEEQPSTNDNIRTLASFVINHYTAGTTAAIEPIVSFMLSDEMIDSIKNMLISPGKPFLETVMESILPTIGELTLYLRVGEDFRKNNVYFEGDSKFWELFIREYLNRAVEIKVKEQYSRPEDVSVERVTAIRNELVREMLQMKDMRDVRRKLLSLPKQVDKDPQPLIKFDQKAGKGVVIMEDYSRSVESTIHQSKADAVQSDDSDDSLNEYGFEYLVDEDEDPFQ